MDCRLPPLPCPSSAAPPCFESGTLKIGNASFRRLFFLFPRISFPSPPILLIRPFSYRVWNVATAFSQLGARSPPPSLKVVRPLSSGRTVPSHKIPFSLSKKPFPLEMTDPFSRLLPSTPFVFSLSSFGVASFSAYERFS